jgi:hypothetical protein
MTRPDINVSKLTSTDGPRLHWLVCGSADVTALDDLLRSDGITVRRLSGRRMRTLGDLFDEFAARLEFPDYFGKNWPALSECLSDLEWLPGSGYAIVVLESDLVLVDGDPGDLEVLLRTLERVADAWSHPIEQGEPWDRPAVPFHLVFQVTPEGSPIAMERFAQAGSRPAPLAAA